MKKGVSVLRDPSLNKGTAFSTEERAALGLTGLLPAESCSQASQVERSMENIRRKAYDIERYIFLTGLQDRNERLYYRTLIDHVEELMPIVYTPTVGQACKEFAHIFRQARGFYITPKERGSIKEILKNWPQDDVRVIVVTDGERILGLGDLGANGMGIPIGKLALYTAGAGIHPSQCLPIQIDVGTNNQEFLDDPLYLGVRKKRLGGDDYYALMDEFIEAVGEVFPKALVQFEDFLTPNAYKLLNRYRDKILSFNDDIQGTAAVVLAGVYASGRLTSHKFKDLRIMFLGAGSAATGIADLMTQAFVKEGLSEAEARKRLSFVDQNGLLVKGREGLRSHNEPYLREGPSVPFIEALNTIKPHILVGATGHPGTFTQEVVETMSKLNEKPVIFALSNPTSRAECTAEQAYEWSQGKAVFASGSPFPAIESSGGTWRPGQGNNAYVFPGIGLGAVACAASRVTDNMFLAAARGLADQVSEKDLKEGALYPPLRGLREVSHGVAEAVLLSAYEEGVATEPKPKSPREYLGGLMYDPTY